MQNISEIESSRSKEAAYYRDILVVSRTFLPKEGGIEEYVYNRCLQNPERIIMLAASFKGDQEFDRVQDFAVHRWYLPDIPHLFGLGAIIKQILNMFWSFFLAIQLYFRYRYRYIEWGHGYDFPAILLLSYLLPINFFIYLHGNDILCPLRNPLLKKLFELTLQRATGIVCNSSFTRDYLSEKFEFNTSIYVINPIVRPEKFGDKAKNQQYLENARLNIRQKFNIPENAIVILSVGRLVKRKGFGRVIDNLNRLVNQNLDVHYIICGRGKMQRELEQKAELLQVKERVHFAGFVPDEDLANYYATSDIFAMLTFFDIQKASIEGFGIVYAEAGYFGKPVIASRVGGVEDAVHHEENGLLVNPDSPEEISQALIRLCKDKQLREKLGSKGIELARRKTPHSIIYSEELGVVS
ncbi:MAG: glycosyltransferase family 4 protein [Rivularia sp. (in: cyanobacteria)]